MRFTSCKGAVSLAVAVGALAGGVVPVALVNVAIAVDVGVLPEIRGSDVLEMGTSMVAEAFDSVEPVRDVAVADTLFVSAESLSVNVFELLLNELLFEATPVYENAVVSATLAVMTLEAEMIGTTLAIHA